MPKEILEFEERRDHLEVDYRETIEGFNLNKGKTEMLRIAVIRRKPKPDSSSDKAIARASGTLFDPEVVEVFLTIVAPFPPGTEVTLSDASWHSKDGRVFMRYEVMENNAEDSNGVLTISVRGVLLKPATPVAFEVIGSPTDSQRWFGIYLLPENRNAKAN